VMAAPSSEGVTCTLWPYPECGVQGGGDEGGDTLPEDVDLELDNIG
jgi:hypothetical protein